MKPREVYADYAAATPTDPAVVEAMAPFWQEKFANPSSIHFAGSRAYQALDSSRRVVASFLNCQSNEVTFTSGGTESNNLAIIGLARANKNRGNRIVTTKIEHPSVLNSCKFLEKEGWRVKYLTPNEKGLISPDLIKRSITGSTVLVSVHLANSEIGVVQDIPAIARAINGRAYFHTDACQATPYLSLDVVRLGVDLLTLNSTKAYGPKGVGALFVSSKVPIYPLSYGGGQEEGLRSGTENLVGIVGFAKALEIITKNREKEYRRIKTLRDSLQKELSKIYELRINVAKSPRLPNHLSVTLLNEDSNLVEDLSKKGIAVSAGSACGARELVPSHVLQAIGLTEIEIHQTVRISLGRLSNATEIRRIVQALTDVALDYFKR